MNDIKIKQPFVAGHQMYLEYGWLPFPAYHTRDQSKAPCVRPWEFDGEVRRVIGWDSEFVDYERMSRPWARDYPTAQLGLRLPKNVLGIDVDEYDGKTGLTRFRQLVAEFGPLPPTWISTSKRNGSGIRLYHVKDSSQFPHSLDGGIDVIRWCGRFILAMPSTHPKTRDPYGFIRPGERELQFEEFPSAVDPGTPDGLPELPASWVTGLGKAVPKRVSVAVTGGNVRSWVEGRPGGRAKPCDGMRATFEAELRAVNSSEKGSRHDAMNRAVHRLVGDSTEGHVGLYWALNQIFKAFEAKRGPEARAEFARSVHPEVEKRMGQSVRERDLCEDWK